MGGGEGVAGIRLPSAEHRFLKNSAESRRSFIFRSRRLMKNLCQSLQISFTVPKKKEKKHSLKFFQAQADSYQSEFK